MSSIITFGKVLTQDVVNIIKFAEEDINLHLRDHTAAEQDALDEKQKNLFRDSGQKPMEGAQDIIRERLTHGLRGRGFSESDIDIIVQRQMRKMENLVATVNRAAPTMKQKIGWICLKAAAAMVVLGTILNIARQQLTQQIATRNNRSYEAAVQKQMRDFELTEDQFNLMIGGMLATQPPAPNEIAVMPAAVAAVADVPVAVEVTTPESGAHEYTAPLGQVYRNAPAGAQRQIEQDAPRIEHDYDKPSVNSCVDTDCLNQHRDEWNSHIGALNQHKDYSVTMGDGSQTVHLSY